MYYLKQRSKVDKGLKEKWGR